MSQVIHVSQVLDPPLQGYRLSAGDFQPLEPDDGGGLESQELGLRLSVGDGRLQFVRVDTGERLLTRAERAEREAGARQREAEARQAAEAEVARLRAELARRPPSAG
jgi:hypothetical protein